MISIFLAPVDTAFFHHLVILLSYFNSLPLALSLSALSFSTLPQQNFSYPFPISHNTPPNTHISFMCHLVSQLFITFPAIRILCSELRTCVLHRRVRSSIVIHARWMLNVRAFVQFLWHDCRKCVRESHFTLIIYDLMHLCSHWI